MLYLSFLVSDSSVEFFAVYAEEVVSRLDDATLDSDGACCVDVVSCHHAHRDASPLARLNGIWNLSKWKGESTS